MCLALHCISEFVDMHCSLRPPVNTWVDVASGCLLVGTRRAGKAVPCPATYCSGLSFLRYPFPMVFSSCSRKDLETSLEKGMGMCLFNLPEVRESFGGQKCGNGFVEEGEQCDCGEPEVRTIPRTRTQEALYPQLGKDDRTWRNCTAR